MLFGLRKRERELYERLLGEKDKTIIALADEIEWLRGSGAATPAVAAQATAPHLLPPVRMQSGAAWMGEEEEDLAHMRAQGLINAGELEEALKHLDFLGTDIEELARYPD